MLHVPLICCLLSIICIIFHNSNNVHLYCVVSVPPKPDDAQLCAFLRYCVWLDRFTISAIMTGSVPFKFPLILIQYAHHQDIGPFQCTVFQPNLNDVGPYVSLIYYVCLDKSTISAIMTDPILFQIVLVHDVGPYVSLIYYVCFRQIYNFRNHDRSNSISNCVSP